MEQNYMHVELPEPKGTKKIAWFTVISDIFFVVALLIMLCYTIFSFTFEYHPVEGYSMQPTFNANSISEDAVYMIRSKEYDIGEIVIAKHNKVLVIKRLVALGGDKVNISYENGECKIYVLRKGASQPLQVDYSFMGGIQEYGTYDDFVEYVQRYPSQCENINARIYINIPEGYVYYLGDNMKDNESEDCADYGPVTQDYLVGKVRFVIYGRTNFIKQIISQLINKPEYI